MDSRNFDSQGLKELVDEGGLHALDCLAVLLEDLERHVKAEWMHRLLVIY